MSSRPNKNLEGMTKRLIALRIARKLSQREVGELLGLGKGATAQTRVMRFENGQEPKSEMLSKFARLYGVSETFIRFGDHGISEALMLYGNAAASMYPAIAIPLLEWGELGKRTKDERRIDVPKWLAPTGARPFAVIMPDDLYAPIFMQGDFLFIDRDENPSIGKHVIVKLSATDHCVCSVFKYGSLSKLQVLDNRIKVPAEKLAFANILGVVVGRFNRL